MRCQQLTTLAHIRLSLPYFLARQPLKRHCPSSQLLDLLRFLAQSFEVLHLVLARREDELAGLAMSDALRRTSFVKRVAASNAQGSLQ